MTNRSSLEDTNASAIAAALVRARKEVGSPALGMVMTLIIDVADDAHEDALAAARTACREHPSRVLGLVRGDARGKSRIDAAISSGVGITGEEAIIHLQGEVSRHADSVVVPLLLPDSPIVVWWPGAAPADPAADPIGALASRRITDAAAAPRAKGRALLAQCETYAPGNTDLAWTRITGWRSLLAAALDQDQVKVSRATVIAERISPSADLLGAWLGGRLRVPVERRNSGGPGITQVTLHTREGDIQVSRADGRHAVLSSPGQPDRPTALRRRELPDLLAEELRHLDPDDVYELTIKRYLRSRKDAS